MTAGAQNEGEVGSKGNGHPQEHESEAGHPRDPLWVWQQLLCRDDRGDQEHPGKAHGAGGHQNQHQGPAAAQAVQPVSKAQRPGCGRSTPVMLEQEPARVAAGSQAAPLDPPLYETFAFIQRRNTRLSPATRALMTLAEQHLAALL